MAAEQLEEAPMTEFSLRQQLKRLMEDTSLTDPHEIAEALKDNIPKHKRAQVLDLLLVSYVRTTMGQLRTGGGSSPLPTASQISDVIKTRHAGGVVTSHKSSKVSAIREGWQRHLRNRIGVGPTEYKMLQDCTYQDLLHAAKQRNKLADQHKEWAARFNAYAGLLTEYEVEKFGDLPVEVHMEVLGAVA